MDYQDEDFSECPLCERTYRTEYLDKHMKKVHPPDYETVVCQYCQKSYKTKNHLHDHIRKIHDRYKSGTSRPKCQQCGKIFSKENNLQRHILHVHNKSKQNKFECDYCGKKFLHKELIQKHVINVHLDTKMVKCELCLKQYKSLYINEHKRRVHPTGQSLECDVCYNKYKTKRLLRVHMAGKHKIKYTEGTHLTHRRLHDRNLRSKEKCRNNVNPVQPKESPSMVKKVGFECSHCNYTFKERFQLMRHLRMLLKKEIYEELDIEETQDNTEKITPSGTKKSQNIIDCSKEDSNENNNANVETKSETFDDNMFWDADNFLFEIKQEMKSENDLEIGPVILQRPDLFNT